MLNPTPYSWIKQVAQPLPHSIVGEDPRYSDDFAQIKQQIEKLSGNDYALVLQLCKKILTEQAKDLRVAGYMVLAATYVYGVTGFIEALQAYNSLIKNHWNSLHPQRNDARATAVRWLNQPRLTSQLIDKAQVSSQEIGVLLPLLQEMTELIKQNLGESWSLAAVLENWLSAQRKNLAQIAARADLQGETTPKIAHSVPNPALGAVKSNQSQSDIDTACTKIIHHYQQQNQWLQAAAYARALRWAGLRLPPHDNYQTRMVAPRFAGLQQLDWLLQNADPKTVLTHCEALFLEPGAHVLLDLQYHACNAAGEMDEPELVAYLEHEVIGLLHRLPELLDLTYVDQKPFANSNTHAWLESLLNSSLQKTEIVQVEATQNQDFSQIDNYIAEIKHQIKRPTLIKLIQAIQALPCENKKSEFIQQWAIGKLCLEYKRPDLSYPILEKLIEVIEKFQLTIWDKTLSVGVYWDYYHALHGQIQTKKFSDAQKQLLAEKIEKVRIVLCQLAIDKALTLV